MNDDVTLIYDVNFMTWAKPNAERLGTAEKVIGRIRIWASSADEAIEIARKIAAKVGQEYLKTINVDAMSGVYREQILNDPQNPNRVEYEEVVNESFYAADHPRLWRD